MNTSYIIPIESIEEIEYIFNLIQNIKKMTPTIISLMWINAFFFVIQERMWIISKKKKTWINVYHVIFIKVNLLLSLYYHAGIYNYIKKQTENSID
jgi:hypothetical protein